MKHLVSFSAVQPLEASAEFRIGMRSVPYLADHGFQDMVVLPGSLYIEVALCVDRKLSNSAVGVVRNAIFRNPIILSAEDTVIKVEVKSQGDNRVEYTFYEGSAGNSGGLPRQYAARLEIERTSSNSNGTETAPFSIEAFQAQSDSVINSDEFYRTLRENGNQYGPSFQKVSSIWRAGNQSLARLAGARQDGEMESRGLDSSLLDAMTQLLAPFIIDKGKTFILRSIERLELLDPNFPEALWGHAILLHKGDGHEKGFLGNVRIFDQSGKPYVELSNVAFTFLDSVDGADAKQATKLIIASNFTAEPVEDAVKFWGDHFDVSIDLEFAPYNQVFQQLLDTTSAFRRNRDGFNVILLGLQEWAIRDRYEPITVSRERAEQCFGTRSRCILPNGLEIVHLNQYETDYLYKEIFADQCYLKHGIRLEDGDTVVDIGANIGLFSLFVISRCKNPKIYAFEPAPIAYDLLKANCDAYGANIRTSNVGVSEKSKTATFTFYEKSSVFSGFHSDENEDREAIQAVVRNMLESTESESVEGYVSELTADRLRRRSYECQLISVSDIIRENQIARIDLLKIDAEKSELDIIRGIDENDWPKIDQIVIEIHDRTGETVKRIKELLIEKGFRCTVEEESLLKHSGLFNLYASRSQAVVRSPGGSLNRNVQEFCIALRSFMDQAAVPLVLCVCPGVSAGAEMTAVLDNAEQALLAETAQITNVHTIGSASLCRRYPVEEFHDAHAHQVGHIPYTQEGYAAIGTVLVRTIFNLRGNPFKVIVLDCDNTLWKGVCGEDGVTGIEVTSPHRALQEFMIGQMKAGMLLCLCSKNNETDALDVFDQRTDMLLKREHLVSWRLNWNSKSANIKALAKELNLGLDSFIFIDDNPVDCADVRINCPEALTLQLPQNPESFVSFLNHIWAFDRAASTIEDQNRTRMYQETRQRQQYREQSFSLKDFVKGLQLRVEITEAAPEQLERVSQLTFRTNQFNFTSIRRSETEIHNFLKREHAHCLVVRVADRFGDYGFVGVVMYRAEIDRYRVDTFLLSCRVLGRGVEHAVVSWLGQRAVKEGKRFVDLTYAPTEKNLPALQFIASIEDQYRSGANTSWIFPAEHLASVQQDYLDKQASTDHHLLEAIKPEIASRSGSTWGGVKSSERLQRIGENLCDIPRLVRAIEEYRLQQPSHPDAADVRPGNPLETTLLNIWRKALGRPRIGLNDNFFEAGGTSLRAVQVIALIKKELKQTLSIVSLFESPTVSLLAASLRPSSEVKSSGAPKTKGAAVRGQRRRYNTMRQHAA